MSDERTRVCPVELANSLDNKIRRWLQNPIKILNPYVNPGMTVTDIGCGPGFFSVEMAKLVGEDGRVFAVDLQEGMLLKIKNKIAGTPLEKIIQTVKCEADEINLKEKADFILLFYMVHEVPDKDKFFKTLQTLLKDTGEILIVEPKLFHVSKTEFKATIQKAVNAGFNPLKGPKLSFSFSAVLKKK